MNKSKSGGASFNYGPVLPPTNITPDGSVFVKTVGSDAGIYLYSITQDGNAFTNDGDQVTQSWVALTSTNAAFVSKTAPGVEQMVGTLRVGSNTVGYVSAVPGTATSPGGLDFYTVDNVRRGNLGKKGTGNTLDIVAENGWNWNFTTAPTVASSPVWTQASLTNLSQLTNGPGYAIGTSSVTATPNTLVLRDASAVAFAANFSQSSANGELASPAQFIVTNGSDGLMRKSSSTQAMTAIRTVATGSWAINAATATSATTATSANTANTATSATTAATATLATKASTLSQGGGNGAAMTFSYSGQAGQPTWLWGTNDGVTTQIYNPSNFSVAISTQALRIPVNDILVNTTVSSGHAGESLRLAAAFSLTVSIDTNANVAIPTGSATTIVNDSAFAATIQQLAGVTLRNPTDGSTGTRTLAARGIATIYKVATNTWYISGTGVS